MNNDFNINPIDTEQLHHRAEEIEQIRKQIREHSGKRVTVRLDQLKRVFDAWAGFSIGLTNLLDSCENNSEFVIELARNIGDTTRKDQILLSLDQATIAYVAGLGAVIDHTRALVNSQPNSLQAAHRERTENLSKEHPEAPFLGKLRNYVLHNVVAPWHFSGEFTDPPTARVSLICSVLLDDKKSWNAAAKTFITSCGQSIQLSQLIVPYFEAMMDYIGDVFTDIIRQNMQEILECNEMIKRYNLLITGGATDGSNWKEWGEHLTDNLKRYQKGEPQLDFRTRKPASGHRE